MRNSLPLFLVSTFCLWSGTARGQAESFTYQGQLKLQGMPLSAEVDMKFTLFDSDSAAEAVAGPLLFDGVNLASVQVSNGLFSAELDFGPGALQLGQWLEIEVRSPHDPGDSGAYTVLTPRQRISAAPFALSVPGLASNEAGVDVEGDIHAGGEMIASAFSSNSPLIFKVNPANVECARFDDATCYMGVGTDAPQARLHVGGVAGVDGIMFPDGSIQTSAAGFGGGDGFWSPSGTDIFNINGGNVGIGTTAPLSKLDISASGEGAELLRFSTERPWVFRQIYTGPSASLQLLSTTGQKRFEITAVAGENVATFFADGPSSRVGIGTTTPLSRLDISASGEGAELLRFSTERPWVFRQIYSGPSAGLQLLSTTGQKRFEITAVAGENVATFFADGANSRVGIGTVDPISRLDIVGQDGLGITGFQPFLTLRDSSAGNARGRIQTAGGTMNFFPEASFAGGLPALSVDGFTTTARCADLKLGHATRRGSPGRALVDNGTHLVINFNSDWTHTFVHGRLKTNILEVAGADLAEKFPSNDRDVEPGTVMEIDPDNAGKLRVAREAYSSRVAGVVSGAGNLQAGAVLGNLPESEDGPAIALSGRVWVHCDASTVAIEPGDLLTTSSQPGHAMKASDRGRSHGAVIGKAMSKLAQGERGLVLVLVNLQ